MGATPGFFVAAHVATSPVIDGKLDEACWRSAQPVRAFYVYPRGGPSRVRTEARVCYDHANLYVGVKCWLAKGVKPRGKMKPHDAYLFRDDEVEIMIDAGRTKTRYYQFCINAYGATYDVSRWRAGAGQDRDWNGLWRAKTRIEPGAYVVEAAFAFASLGVTPNTGSEWGLNICRTSVQPYELSSIAGGAFNRAGSFLSLRGIDADLRKYCYQIGPAAAEARRSPKGCAAVLHAPVRNLTGAARNVRIEVLRRGRAGQPAGVARSVAATLRNGGSIDVTLERLEMTRLFPHRTNFYVRPKLQTAALAVKDAATGETCAYASLAPSAFGEKLQACWEPIRLVVKDPWRPRAPAGKTEAVELTVRCAVSGQGEDALRLRVQLASAKSGKVVAERSIPRPAASNAIRFDARALPWGAYRVRASLQDRAGAEAFAAEALAIVLPGPPHQIETLNMLVAELMNARKRGLLGRREIAFMNPRHGWCFFRFAGSCAVTLDDDPHPLGSARRGAPAEAMRLLPAGKHVLHVNGAAEEIIVRAVPALLYNAHQTGTQIHPFGVHTWARLKRCVLPNCNMIESVGSLREAELAEWRAAGKCWLRNAARPGLRDPKAGPETAYRLWRQSLGYSHPLFSGIQIDEFGPGTYSEQGYVTLARQTGLLAEDPKFRGRLLIPFACHVYQSSGGLVFMKAVLAAGWPFSEEWYIGERSSETEAREWIRRWMVGAARGWEAALPGSVRRMIVTLMYSALPYCTTNTSPSVDFKTHLDLQFHLLATDPTFHGLWGVQPYRSNYADLDTLYWTGRLMWHYCIEGRSERLSSDPYVLPHLRNPDFDDGARHWRLQPAEPGRMRAGSYEGYGRMEGRYHPKGSEGDRFLLLTRSAKGPNSFSQEVRALTPGRLYSLRMYTGDYDDLRAGKSRRTRHAVSIRLDGVDILPGRIHSFQYPFRSYRASGGFSRRKPFWMNFHWRVFRAKGRAARLTVTDWASADKPGGPAGQTLMFNFIELQPYAGPAEEATTRR